MTGVGFGTPPYMPPEQLEDAKHADARADVYALGCMLFEAAALRLPYPGPTPTSVMGAHLKVRAGAMKAPRPRDVDPAVPAALDEACASALELELERRAPSVATLLAALDGAAPTRFEPAPAPGALTISGTPTTPPEAPTAPASAPNLSRLPTGAGVPTGTPRALPPRSEPPPATAAAAPAGPRRALAVGVALLLALVGAFAADVGGLRRRVGALSGSTPGRPSAEGAPPTERATERAPDPSTAPMPATEPPAPTPAAAPALVALTPADGAVVFLWTVREQPVCYSVVAILNHAA
jgi:serine/threonine-protein kinase